MGLRSDDLRNWVKASLLLQGHNRDMIIMNVQGLGQVHGALRVKEGYIADQHGNEKFDESQSLEQTLWSHIAKYWAKELFDTVSLIVKIENLQSIDVAKLKRYKKELNYVRQPLAKMQVASKGGIGNWSSLLFSIGDRTFGWEVIDEKREIHVFSRLWLAEEFLNIVTPLSGEAKCD